MGCLVLLYHRLFEGSVSLDLGSQHRNTHPQGWRLFPCRHRTPIPALHMREMKGDAAVITPGAMPWGHQMHNYTREMHLLPANAWRLLIKAAVVTNMQSLYPGCSLCLKRPLGSSLLGLLLFSALCSRSPPLRPLPCLHSGQHSPSPLLCADLGQLLQHAGLEWFIFLSIPDFQDSQRPLQGNTSPEKCPFPAKGAEVMTFLFFHWYLGHSVGYRDGDHQHDWLGATACLSWGFITQTSHLFSESKKGCLFWFVSSAWGESTVLCHREVGSS